MWTFVGSSQKAVDNTATSATIPMPAGAQAGDVAILAAFSDFVNNGLTFSSNFTTVSVRTNNAPTYRLGLRRLDGTLDEVTVDIPGTSATGVGVILAVFRGLHPTDLIDTACIPSTSSSNTPGPVPPALTTTNNNALRVVFGAIDDDNVTNMTAPAGFSDLVTQASSGTVALAFKVEPTGGTNLDPGAFGGSGNDAWHAGHFALRGAVDGGGPTAITATGSATLVLAGSGSAIIGNAAQGSASLALAGSGAASVAIAASGAGSIELAGQGAASVSIGAQGSGALALTGSGAADLAISGTGSAALALTASGVIGGIAPITATGSATLILTGGGAAAVGNLAQGSAALALDGSGQAEVEIGALGSGVINLTASGVLEVFDITDGTGTIIAKVMREPTVFTVKREQTIFKVLPEAA